MAAALLAHEGLWAGRDLEKRAANEPTILMVPVDIAEAHAAWAWKRLSTAEEWTLEVTTLGHERPDCGQI